MSDELLTTVQAAERLGINRTRVGVLIREGRLPALRVGRDWLLKAVDVEAFAKLPRTNGYPKGKPRSTDNDASEKE